MRNFIFILTALLLLIAPAAAHAEDARASGPEYMVQGEESYNQGDYDKAMEFFQAALPLLTDPADKARAHKRLAFIYAAFGRMDDVYKEFVLSLKLDPTLELDPNLASPKIYGAYRKARDEMVREGTLVCSCDPPGAECYLDGVLLGQAPVRKEHVREGDYTLTLKKPGYETSTGGITIKKDIVLTVEDRLVEARGEVYIASGPPGAAVVFDGRDAGATPVTVKKVEGGDHKLTLRRDYFDAYETTVAVLKGEKKVIRTALKRRLMLIGVVEGAEPSDGLGREIEDITSGPLSRADGLRALPTGLKPLEARMQERGLEPDALLFMRQGKARLDLEDSAVLSGIMEESSAELALAAVLRDDGAVKSLTLTLYSTASDAGDVAVLTAGDMDGLRAGFEGFLKRWSDQEKAVSPTIGARLADRAAGGMEIITEIPGYPASLAGLNPGDVITSVDKIPADDSKKFKTLLKPGTTQEVGFLKDGKARTASVSPVNAPVETPLDSPGYLYNLALVDYSSLLEEDLKDAVPKATRGYAALGLGNVYSRMGDYDKAVTAYKEADTGSVSGVCTGTALYRLGGAYERLGMWVEAAGAYRKAMMQYPDATVGNAEGEYVAPLARERLKQLYMLGLVKERWWL